MHTDLKNTQKISVKRANVTVIFCVTGLVLSFSQPGMSNKNQGKPIKLHR
jgi:hypothetical protein